MNLQTKWYLDLLDRITRSIYSKGYYTYSNTIKELKIIQKETQGYKFVLKSTEMNNLQIEMYRQVLSESYTISYKLIKITNISLSKDDSIKVFIDNRENEDPVICETFNTRTDNTSIIRNLPHIYNKVSDFTVKSMMS